MAWETVVAHITELMAAQATAIRERNVEAATTNYASDVFVFDVVGPLAQPKGVDSVKARLQQWFSSFAEGKTIEFELVDLSISAGESLAYSYSFNQVHAPMSNGGSLDRFWRETLCWQNRNGEWKIVHAHSSVPFDASTGKASIGLKP